MGALPILLPTYTALNDQAPSYLKDLLMQFFPNRALHSQTAGLLVYFLEFLKVEWEAEPSVIRPLSCGTSCQQISGKQTPSQTLRLGLKLSFLTKLIVSSCSGDPETSHSYAAIGQDCSLCSLFLSCKNNIIVVINLCFSFSAGFPGLVLWCLLAPLSCPLKPELVEADGRPPWVWFCQMFIPVEREFFLSTVTLSPSRVSSNSG